MNRRDSSKYLQQYSDDHRKPHLIDDEAEETTHAGSPYYLKDRIWDEATRNAHKRGEGEDLTPSRRGRGPCSGNGFKPIWEMERYLGRPLRDNDFEDGVMEPSNIRDLQENSIFKEVHVKRKIWE